MCAYRVAIEEQKRAKQICGTDWDKLFLSSLSTFPPGVSVDLITFSHWLSALCTLCLKLVKFIKLTLHLSAAASNVSWPFILLDFEGFV